MRSVLSLGVPLLAALLSGCDQQNCPPPQEVYIEDGEYAPLDMGSPFGQTITGLSIEGDMVTLSYEENGQQVEVRWRITDRTIPGE